LRPEERLLDFREEDLRPPILRRLEAAFLPPRFRDDFLAPDDFRAPLDRLRALLLRPPLLRPEDPDRDLFLPLFRLLDFLAAAMGVLRVGGFARTDSKIRAQHRGHHQILHAHTFGRHATHQRITRVSPCRIIQSCLLSRPADAHCSRIAAGGSSIGSSVSLNVPQCDATITRRRFSCRLSS
jgi:hypothetical protein